MDAHLNLDFKIKLFHNVDCNSLSNRIGDAHQASHWDSLIHVEVQIKIISANPLHHKILAINHNLEDKMILDVLKDKTHVMDHNNHKLANDLAKIEFLRKIRNQFSLQKRITILLYFEKLKKK